MQRALLVGINQYPDPANRLHGCVNDVQDMAKFLTASCGFDSADIRLLCDKRATREAIMAHVGWLLNGAAAADHLVFHYSGHGAQMADRNPQGAVHAVHDAICPYDFDWTDQHAVRDVDFGFAFDTVPEGVHFVWVADSCFSGGLAKAFGEPKTDRCPKRMRPPADLEWRLQTALSSKRYRPRVSTMKDVAGLLRLALIAGCTAQEESSDALIDGRYNGALTYFLLQELRAKAGLTEPLSACVQHVAKAVHEGGYDQTPELHGLPALFSGTFAASAPAVRLAAS